MLGSFVVITLTNSLLKVVDQLCIAIVQAAEKLPSPWATRITILPDGPAGNNISTPGVGAVITIFLADLAITSAVIAWLYLLVRKALLLVAIVFAPPRPVRIIVGRHEGWISKWAMLVVALICSKLVLVVLFLVAIAQITAPINGVLCSISDRWPGWC